MEGISRKVELKKEGLVSKAVKCIGTQYKQRSWVDKFVMCPSPQTFQVTEK